MGLQPPTSRPISGVNGDPLFFQGWTSDDGAQASVSSQGGSIALDNGNLTGANSIGVGAATITNYAFNVAALPDPPSATAEDCANAINSIITNMVNAGLMSPGGG